MNKYIVTPNEFDRLCRLLAHQVKENNQDYDVIIPIARGGLAPAQYIAYELDIKNIYTVTISTYEGTKQNLDDIEKKVESIKKQIDLFINHFYDTTKRMPSILFVDDLIDSGKTYNIFKAYMNNWSCDWDYAVIYNNNPSEFKYNIIYAQKKPDAWVVFPWD